MELTSWEQALHCYDNTINMMDNNFVDLYMKIAKVKVSLGRINKELRMIKSSKKRIGTNGVKQISANY